MLNKLQISTKFNILKTAYQSLFESHLQNGTQPKKYRNYNNIPEDWKLLPLRE